MFLFDKFIQGTEFVFICSGMDCISMKADLPTAMFVSVGITIDGFEVFYDEFRSPVLVRKGGGVRVEGEVYAMTRYDLIKLDFLMTLHSLARKEKIQVKLKDGKLIEAWGYFYRPLRLGKKFRKASAEKRTQRN